MEAGCSSPELIRAVADSLRACRSNDQGAVEAAVANLRAVEKTHSAPAPLYRTIDEFELLCQPSKLAYADGDRLRLDAGVPANHGSSRGSRGSSRGSRKSTDIFLLSDEMQSGNCHDGQTKLTLALLEFVQGAAAKHPGAPMHLVYVGASSRASDAVRVAFPAVRQTIFDPAVSMIHLMPPGYRQNARVIDKSALIGEHPNDHIVAVRDFFGDETASAIRSARGIDRAGELLLFTSDVRASENATDDSIVKDMIDQQRWALLIRCDRFMFKFRIPYDEGRAEAIARYGPPRGFKPDGKSMHYLAGDLFFQAYPSVGSAEMRLVGTGRRRKAYDISRIEDLAFAHNHFWRAHAMFANQTGAGEAGIAPYDRAVEARIIGAIPGSARARVARAIDAGRERSGKQTLQACVGRRKPGRRNPGPIGAALASCEKKSAI